MPVKLGSKLPTDDAEARIEIVPLIDIMFFLLAAFMLVSLSMVNMKSVKVNLPVATTAVPDTKRDFVDISVDASGGVFLDKTPLGGHELVAALTTLHKTAPSTRIVISGDRNARHGDVLRVLDLVRSAGIAEVAFETRQSDSFSDKAATP